MRREGNQKGLRSDARRQHDLFKKEKQIALVVSVVCSVSSLLFPALSSAPNYVHDGAPSSCRVICMRAIDFPLVHWGVPKDQYGPLLEG